MTVAFLFYYTVKWHHCSHLLAVILGEVSVGAIWWTTPFLVLMHVFSVVLHLPSLWLQCCTAHAVLGPAPTFHCPFTVIKNVPITWLQGYCLHYIKIITVLMLISPCTTIVKLLKVPFVLDHVDWSVVITSWHEDKKEWTFLSIATRWECRVRKNFLAPYILCSRTSLILYGELYDTAFAKLFPYLMLFCLLAYTTFSL